MHTFILLILNKVYEINVNLNSCASNVIPALKNNTKSSIIIYHTFEEFFDFHFQFIEATFSNKENKNNISINQIPTLPYQIQCVNDRIARKRISGLQTYINVSYFNFILYIYGFINI